MGGGLEYSHIRSINEQVLYNCLVLYLSPSENNFSESDSDVVGINFTINLASTDLDDDDTWLHCGEDTAAETETAADGNGGAVSVFVDVISKSGYVIRRAVFLHLVC